jgi:formaldehyde-activating enzyme involved in methanogenesis
MAKIVVIDGQGGALGSNVIAALKKKNISGEIMAVGTNSAATVSMLGAGAHHGATGENPILVACSDADVIVGPVGIIVSNSMFGEITPAVAKAVAESRAKKFLIPVNKCDVTIVGVSDLTYSEYVKLTASAVFNEIEEH